MSKHNFLSAWWYIIYHHQTKRKLEFCLFILDGIISGKGFFSLNNIFVLHIPTCHHNLTWLMKSLWLSWKPDMCIYLRSVHSLHWGVIKLRQIPVACSVSSHYLNKWRLIFKKTYSNKLSKIRSKYDFVYERAIENVVCRMSAILSDLNLTMKLADSHRYAWWNKNVLLYDSTQEEW